MEKGQKIIVLASIAIIIITSILIAFLSPGAFEEQCKQKAREMLNSLYSIDGGKEKFLRSYSQGLLSDKGQVMLQNLKNLIGQCPNLKSLSEVQQGLEGSAKDIF